jgi:hypothetical protein
MTEVDLHALRKDAAVKLQKFVQREVRSATGVLVGTPLRLHDEEAQRLVEAIAIFTIRSLEHYMPQKDTDDGD